jgi:hypothetical protein
MKSSLVDCVVPAALALAALGCAGCAEVYTPRPSDAVVISGNGFGGYRVYRHGENLGSEWAIRDAVSGDPRAEAEADVATGERVGGVVTGILGAIGIGVGAGLMGYDGWGSNGTINNGLGTAGIAILVGGIALAITGGALNDAAHTHTFNAANMFNDDMAARGPTVPTIYVPAQQPLSERDLSHSAVALSLGPGYAAHPADAPIVTR